MAEATLTIRPINMGRVRFLIKGTAPYVQSKFSKRAIDAIIATQEAGSTISRGKKAKAAKDFTAAYKEAMHLDADGQVGCPCAGLRNALISACRLVDYQMTKAKLSIFVDADTFDVDEGSPLFFLRGPNGEPPVSEPLLLPSRNATGVVDIHPRPIWREWSATPRVKWDADQFTQDDVFNLLMRVGEQVGLGEGRHGSKMSYGMGFGTFHVEAAING